MTKVRVLLPNGHETGFRSSMTTMSQFAVADVDDVAGAVAIEPREGAGTVRRYFEAFKLADAATDLADGGVWRPIFETPPYSPKPELSAPEQVAQGLAALEGRTDLPAVAQRLGARVGLAEPAELPAVLRDELPPLFERYPGGSLWYVTVDHVLLSRLAFARISSQLQLTPDIDYDPDARDGVTYFGMHTITGGVDFGKVLDSVLLAVPPTAIGMSKSTFPHPLVFLFGEFEDLRIRSPGDLARAFYPDVSAPVATPGIKVPVDNLATAHLEALLRWWTTRLNVVYSRAADPTRFSRDGEHDAAAQVGWFFTLERMMADATALLSAINAPQLLRAQAAFDLLDKADSLLSPPHKNAEGKNFKRLLRRQEMLPRLERALRQLPLQLQQRFLTYARGRYDQFYADVQARTMAARRRPNGVLVAKADSSQLALMPWDEYVPELLRAARNSSHGLQDIMRGPRNAGDRDQRLLLATNSGDVPSSFFEVVWVAYLALMADAERLCNRTWWDG